MKKKISPSNLTVHIKGDILTDIITKKKENGLYRVELNLI